MSRARTCVYCGVSLVSDARFCHGCNARLVSWSDPSPEDHPSEVEPAVEETSAAPSDRLVPPQPGDLVGGLFRLTERVLARQVSAADFCVRIDALAEILETSFSDVKRGLMEIPGDVATYRTSLVSHLELTRFLFLTSLQELRLFGDDGNGRHLILGRLLAQRAELEYIQLLARIASDASADPYVGEAGVLGQLARALVEGRMTAVEYSNRLDALETTVAKQMEAAQQALASGFEGARRYDGAALEGLGPALDDFARARDLLAGVVLNLADPEEVQRSVVTLVRETVASLEVEPTKRRGRP